MTSKKYIKELKKNKKELILAKNDYIPKDEINTYKDKI